MTQMTSEQRIFLERISTGDTIEQAAKAIGRSRSIPWNWSKKNTVFADAFAAVYPKYRATVIRRQSKLSLPEAAPVCLSNHELAMRRLLRELRVDGPNAVLAAAAIVLTSPQAAPVDSPAVETDESVEVSAVPDQFALTAPVQETPQSILTRMFDEVFGGDQPCNYEGDTLTIRYCMERYFGFNLEEHLNMSGHSIGNNLGHIARRKFPVAMVRRHKHHASQVYLLPTPKTRA
jgi:hypothetical protein